MRGTRLGRAIPVAAIFVVAFLYRGLAVELTNDDFLFVAGAQQIARYGEGPISGFLPEGRPLHYGLSAAAYVLSGGTLAGELFLDVTLLAAGAALTFVIVRAMTASPLSALFAALFVIVFGPRLYNYGKIVLPPLWLWCLWAYAGDRSMRRMATLTACVAASAWYRHDFGVYCVLGTCAALIVLHWPSGARKTAWRVGGFALGFSVLMLPLAVAAQFGSGSVEYIRQSVAFADRGMDRSELKRPRFAVDRNSPFVSLAPRPATPRAKIAVRWAAHVALDQRSMLERRYGLLAGVADEGRTWRYELEDPEPVTLRALINDPSVEDTNNVDRGSGRIVAAPAEPIGSRLRRYFPPLRLEIARNVRTRENAVAWLFYVTMLTPVAVLLMLLWRARRRPLDRTECVLVGAAVLGLTAALVLIRGSLNVNGRLTEMASIVAILGAGLYWLCRRIRAARAAVAAGLVLTAWSAAVDGAPVTQLRRIGVLDGLQGVTEQARRQLHAAVSPSLSASFATREPGLSMLVEYIRECTSLADKVLVTWYGPEVHVYAQRGFAGGRTFFSPGFWGSQADQRAVIGRLERESVPIVVADVGAYEGGTRYHLHFQRGFPLVDEYLRGRYVIAGEPLVGDNDSRYQVMIDRRLTPTRVHAATGYPCFADTVLLAGRS
jgi:hypothetical protein